MLDRCVYDSVTRWEILRKQGVDSQQSYKEAQPWLPPLRPSSGVGMPALFREFDPENPYRIDEAVACSVQWNIVKICQCPKSCPTAIPNRLEPPFQMKLTSRRL